MAENAWKGLSTLRCSVRKRTRFLFSIGKRTGLQQTRSKTSENFTGHSWLHTGRRSPASRAHSSAPQFTRPPPGSLLFTSVMSSRENGSDCAISRRLHWPQRSALALPANELLHAAIRFVVGHLNRRMFGEIGGW